MAGQQFSMSIQTTLFGGVVKNLTKTQRPWGGGGGGGGVICQRHNDSNFVWTSPLNTPI